MNEKIKDKDCIFCKIIDGHIPSYKVYEDENFFGFLTIKPQCKGHTLLIPKNHYSNILELPREEYLDYFETAKKIAEKINSIFVPKRVAFVIAGLEVAHTHLHIYALNENEELNPHHAKDATKEELEEAQKMLTK